MICGVCWGAESDDLDVMLKELNYTTFRSTHHKYQSNQQRALLSCVFLAQKKKKKNNKHRHKIIINSERRFTHSDEHIIIKFTEV